MHSSINSAKPLAKMLNVPCAELVPSAYLHVLPDLPCHSLHHRPQASRPSGSESRASSKP